MSSQKTALVTGTSKGGIGDYLAQELHSRGFRVFATARSPAKVEHLKEMGLKIVLLEVTDSDSIKKAVEQVTEATGGKLDILVNNSGVGYMASLLDADMSPAKAMFDVNVWAVLEVTQAFSPLLIASKGTIVNIGSVAGRLPIPFEGIYNISKAALEHLSRQMRVEFAPFDVKVVHVVTGGIKTGFFAHAEETELPETSPYYPGREALGPWMKAPPEEYARSVINNVLKTSPTTSQWVGYGTFVTWLASNVLWNTATVGFPVTDLVLWGMGVPNLKKAIFGSKCQKKID
ncbi:hypothetical protein Neosp_001947 [[Neocosmospora] mangrovei]